MTFEDIQKKLIDNGICCEINEHTDGKLSVNIEFGDWKHDHAYCDYLMKECGYRLVEEVLTREDGSDCYDSIHYYENEKNMTLNDIRKVLRSHSLAWKFGWIKDYGNGTKLIEYKSYNSARSRKHIGILQIGYRENDWGVISCGYTNVEGEHIEINSLDEIKGVA